MKVKKIILASASPRRKELLAKTGKIFDIVSPDFDENIINKEFSYKLIEDTAKNKCLSVLKKTTNPAIIISADTVVINNNIILGKPKDYSEAIKTLSSLSGKTHKVVTAVCIINTENKKEIIVSETSTVTFNKLSEEQIKSYVEKFKPYDKAGSYGIQELPDGFVSKINGDFDNIIGFPLKTVTKILETIENI